METPGTSRPVVFDVRVPLMTLENLETSLEMKFQAIEQINIHFESVVNEPNFTTVAERILPLFLRLLRLTPAHFLAESTNQKFRKTILEIIQRLPTCEATKLHIKDTISLLFQLLKIDNEENVQISMRILIELHKQFKPSYSHEIGDFLTHIRSIYSTLVASVQPGHPATQTWRYLFEFGRQSIRAKSIDEVDVEEHLNKTFSQTTIAISNTQPGQAEQPDQFTTLLPRGTQSLKVLSEIPMVAVLFYQMYKQNMHNDLVEFLPLLLDTIAMHPPRPELGHDLYADFVTVQVKALSFAAYIVRSVYSQDAPVPIQVNNMASGVMCLLSNCPSDAPNTRRDMLMGVRHIMLSDLKQKFLPYASKLLDEKTLIGPGYTAQEYLKTIVISMLNEFGQNMRNQLDWQCLTLCFDIFARYLHDEHLDGVLPPTVRVMACKLLTTILDAVIKSNQASRETLLALLTVHVRKLKFVATRVIPVLAAQAKTETETDSSGVEGMNCSATLKGSVDAAAAPFSFGLPAPYQESQYIPADYQSLVRHLTVGMKTLVWALCTLESSSNNETNRIRTLEAVELTQIGKGLQWGMLCMNVYSFVHSGCDAWCKVTYKGVSRSKDERDVIEHFAAVFGLLNPSDFTELLSSHTEIMIDAMTDNPALLNMVNAFLSNSKTSYSIANIMLQYLMKNLEVIGDKSQRSALCMKLFKTLFTSVNMYLFENGPLLKPHLRAFVTQNMRFALTAPDPMNYFHLLRALFRSIGGGTHDLLYQEFLPVLPALLNSLNHLQAKQHTGPTHELIVELCLTVPVRLSSLLPYLPLLMEPLVAALGGSASLVAQGLRTLELCVDNLQPEFLFDHIAPVRAPLMQALWTTVRCGEDKAAAIAYRVLGKFGGSNRKLLGEPQKIKVNPANKSPIALDMRFPDDASFELNLDAAVRTCRVVLENGSGAIGKRRAAAQFVRGFLAGLIDCGDTAMFEVYMENTVFEPNAQPSSMLNRPMNSKRDCARDALIGLVYAVSDESLRSANFDFFVHILRHLVLLSIHEKNSGNHCKESDCLDAGPLLADCVQAAVCSECDSVREVGLAMAEAAQSVGMLVLKSERAGSKRPLIEYLAETAHSLCHKSFWLQKRGGLLLLQSLLEKQPPAVWSQAQLCAMTSSLLFCANDLASQTANGCLEIIDQCFERIADVAVSQPEMLSQFATQVVRALWSQSSRVRSMCRSVLERLVERSAVGSFSDAIHLAKDLPSEMLNGPDSDLRHLSLHGQIAFASALAVVMSIKNPPLFNRASDLHGPIFDELCGFLECDDSTLLQQSRYRNAPLHDISTLQCATCEALAAMAPQCLDEHPRLFSIFYKCLHSNDEKLRPCGSAAIRKLLTLGRIDTEFCHQAMRPLLLALSDPNKWTYELYRSISWLTLTFTSSFNDKFCEQLLSNLSQLIPKVTYYTQSNTAEQQQYHGNRFDTADMKACATILEIFHQIPAATTRFVELLVSMIVGAETQMRISHDNVLRLPLLKFLVKHPEHTVQYFLSDVSVRQEYKQSMFIWLATHELGAPLRKVLQSQPTIIINLLHGSTLSVTQPRPSTTALQSLHGTVIDTNHVEELALRLCQTVIKHAPDWIYDQTQLVQHLRSLWNAPEFRERYTGTRESIVPAKWIVPRRLAYILLTYYKGYQDDVGLLFELLYGLSSDLVGDFSFIAEYLSDALPKATSEWKRSAFMKYLEWHDNKEIYPCTERLVLQHVIVPCFMQTFESDDIDNDTLIGGPADPDVESDDNLVSLFARKILPSTACLLHPNNICDHHCDALRILLTQLACLFVQMAGRHIHDSSSRKQGLRLRSFMVFGWSSLTPTNIMDPTVRCYGHLLIAHIIARFAINRKIVLQVYVSLLKLHQIECRSIAQHALSVLVPAVPQRCIEDGHSQLASLAHKAIVDAGHVPTQVSHILSLVVAQEALFYPERHLLIYDLVAHVQRQSFTQQTTAAAETRRLALDVVEVIVSWELRSVEAKRALETTDSSKPAAAPKYIDMMANFLIRFGSYIIESATSTKTSNDQPASSSLGRRCQALLSTILKPGLFAPIDMKVLWMDKLFTFAESSSINATTVSSICAALDMLAFLMRSCSPQQAFLFARPLQHSISRCVASTHTRIVRASCTLIEALLGAVVQYQSFNPSSLEALFRSITTALNNGFNGYATQSVVGLQQPLTLLAALEKTSAQLVRSALNSFLEMMVKLTNDATKQPSGQQQTEGDQQQVLVDTLSKALKLQICFLSLLTSDQRRILIVSVLYVLLERCRQPAIMQSVVDIIALFVRFSADTNPVTVSQAPSATDQKLLVVKLQAAVLEKNLDDDECLREKYYEHILLFYSHASFRNTEYSGILEPSFLRALTCGVTELQNKFFTVLNERIDNCPYHRLFYVVCCQHWDSRHYWICIALALLLSTAQAPEFAKKRFHSQLMWHNFWSSTTGAAVPMEVDSGVEVDSVETKPAPEDLGITEGETGDLTVALSKLSVTDDLSIFIRQQRQFLQSIAAISQDEFLKSLRELIMLDEELAHQMWLSLLPIVWLFLGDERRASLQPEINAFLSSGFHNVSADSQTDRRTALHTFLDSLTRCKPTVHVKPFVLSYLGAEHNLWHQAVICLEAAAFAPNAKHKRRWNHVAIENSNVAGGIFAEDATDQELFESLCSIYESLNENDLRLALWANSQRDLSTPLVAAVALEQSGQLDLARQRYEASAKQLEALILESDVGASAKSTSQLRFIEDRWLSCCRELGHWEQLQSYKTTKKRLNNLEISMESAWRLSAWDDLQTTTLMLQQGASFLLAPRISLYRGFLSVCKPNEQRQLGTVESHTEAATWSALKAWRRLPDVVSHAHVPLLQLSQRIVELQEAAQISNVVAQSSPVRPTAGLQELKAIIKTWKNRLPTSGDSLSHWLDIFDWRHLHFLSLSQNSDAFETASQAPIQILGVHACAQNVVNLAQACRRHNALDLAESTLGRLYTLPHLPVVDAYQQVRQRIKCIQTRFGVNSGGEDAGEGIARAIGLIDSLNLNFFTKEMNSDLFCLRGRLCSFASKVEEANKAISAALQINDGSIKAWNIWGDHLDRCFARERTDFEQASRAIVCFMQAARQQDESKARKIIGRVLWLLKHSRQCSGGEDLHDVFEKHIVAVPALNYIYWLDDFLAHYRVYRHAPSVRTLLLHVAATFPQHVICRLQRHATENDVLEDVKKLRMVEILEEVKKLKLVEGHTTVKMLAELAALRYNWWCSALSVFRLALRALLDSLNTANGDVENAQAAFANSEKFAVLLTFLRSTEEPRCDASEVLLISRLKERCLSEISTPDLPLLSRDAKPAMTSTLIKWTKTIEGKVTSSNRCELLPALSPFLGSFSDLTCTLYIPSDVATPKQLNYCIKIVRFGSHTRCLLRNGLPCRRITVYGHNGRKYRYLLLERSTREADEAGALEQIFHAWNLAFQKNKETASRFVRLAIQPRCSISPRLDLVEHEPMEASLLDMFQEHLSQNSTATEEVVMFYFDQMLAVRARGGSSVSHQILKDIFTKLEHTLAPRTLLHDMAVNRLADASDFFAFRKAVSTHLSALCLAEYVLHLRNFTAEQVLTVCDTGSVHVQDAAFDVLNEEKFELNGIRPLPFRITPTVVHLLGNGSSSLAISSLLMPPMLAAVHSLLGSTATLMTPTLLGLWRAAAARKEENEFDEATTCSEAVQAWGAIRKRLNSLATTDGSDNRVQKLALAASSPDNLCRMPPTWHPWL